MSKLDELEKMSQLKKDGIITEDEFKEEKRKLLNNAGKNNISVNTDKNYMIGFALSIYATVFMIISFYIDLGLFLVDLLVGTILSIVALVINVRLKKQVEDKNVFVKLGISFSIISIILLLPSIFNFISYFDLYV